MAFAPNGKVLAVGDATALSLQLIDPETRKPIAKVRLAGRPEGLAWSADGKRLFVSEASAGSIAEINPARGQIVRHISVGRYPGGLALVDNRGMLLACDRGFDRLTVINLTNGKTDAQIPVGRQPGHVVVTPDESLAVVINLIPATAATSPDHATEITLVDLETLGVCASVRLPTGSTNARGVAIDADGGKAYVVHTIGRFHLPTTQLDCGWVNTNALSILDLKTGTRTATVLLDQVTEGAADPWGAVFSPDSSRLFITLSGVHQLAVIDLNGLSAMLGPDPATFTNDLSILHREQLIRRVDLPAKGPRGIGISNDGRTLAVAGYFSRNLILLDSETLTPTSIPFGPQLESDIIRRGEIAFHDADRCFQRWLSCATCHAQPLYTNLLSFDVGTATPLDRGETQYDTPTLIELWRTPPSSPKAA